MRGRDIKAVGELAGEASHVVTTLVRDMHAGIAGRVFGAIGALSKPTQVIHDGIAGTVYCAVDHGLRGATQAGGVLASQVWGRDDDAGLDSRARVGAALAAVNGIYGHRLASHRNGLALTMQIRQHGSVVPLCEGSVSAAFPEATGRVAVFVHGWCATERLWWWPPCEDDARCYGQRLAEDLGFTPIYLRYNTGLHISQNGQLLAGMLERLQLVWPVPIDELVVVGHSMGGLVARSAGYYGMQQHHRWTAAVRHVVCLGSPHLGADLEKGVNVAAWALARLPETRAVAGFLNRRSPGVKDLRFGALIEEAPSSRRIGVTVILTNSSVTAAMRCRFAKRRLSFRRRHRRIVGAGPARRRLPGAFIQCDRHGQVPAYSVRRRPWADTDRPAPHGPAQPPADLREVAGMGRHHARADRRRTLTYGKSLGVTAIELMPVHHSADDSTLIDKGLSNYWGYNTIVTTRCHHPETPSDGERLT